jgi:hypothetical protein
MIESIIALIFSKLGGLAAAMGGLLALWLWGKWNKRRAEKAEARADGLQAQIAIQDERERIQDETDQQVKKVDDMVQAGDAPGLSDAFNRLRDR